MIVEVKWNGSLYKDQIQLDFFNALLPRLISSDSKILKDDSPSISCSQEQFDDYHFVHEELESLTDLSGEVSGSQRAKTPLGIPNGDQIRHIPDIVDKRVFSIAQEIDSIGTELARVSLTPTKIKRTDEIEEPSHLPIVFVASCAAVLFFVTQKIRRSS
jgi:hypothetical protein